MGRRGRERAGCAPGRALMRRARGQVGKNEVVMTLEQAKAAKLAKGFALEPVLPGSLDQAAPLPEGTKRDRKKADLVGMMRGGGCFHRLLPSPAPCAFLLRR